MERSSAGRALPSDNSKTEEYNEGAMTKADVYAVIPLTPRRAKEHNLTITRAKAHVKWR
jgi:hypothetical protein